jgi:branched-chain amino acid transport system substrate-binding protein
MGVKATAKEVLKIGAMGTLSGPGTAWGVATQRGVQLAMDEFNNRGGLKADGKRYELKQIIYDDKYTGKEGTSAAQRLIYEDKVKFIMGPIGSAPSLAAGLIANREKILILCNGYSNRILSPKKPYTFRVTLTTQEFAPAGCKWLAKNYPDKKTVVLTAPNDESGQAMIPMQKDAYTKAGIKIIGVEWFERGITDFVPMVTRIIGKNPDIYELSGAPGDEALMVKTAKQLGFKGLLSHVCGGPAQAEVIRVAGDLADGHIGYDNFNPADPNVQFFVKAYDKKYGGYINPFCPLFFIGTKLLFDTIEKVGTTDVEKVRAALEKSDGYVSMFGPISWGGEKMYGIRHQILEPFYMSRIENGKVKRMAKVMP